MVTATLCFRAICKCQVMYVGRAIRARSVKMSIAPIASQKATFSSVSFSPSMADQKFTHNLHAFAINNCPRTRDTALKCDTEEGNHCPSSCGDENRLSPYSVSMVWCELDHVCDAGEFRKGERGNVEHIRCILTLWDFGLMTDSVLLAVCYQGQILTAGWTHNEQYTEEWLTFSNDAILLIVKSDRC